MCACAIDKCLSMVYNIARERNKEEQIMKQFEIGATYSMTSACDHECVWTYIVIARTASTITLMDDQGKTIKCRINSKFSEYCGAEVVFPLGRYSMAPILRAE